MWCVVVLEGEGAPPYPASVRPMVLPNPSMLLPFRINNRQGRDMVCGSTARCMRGGACHPPEPRPQPPTRRPSTSTPPPIPSPVPLNVDSDLSDDATLQHPALLLSAAAQPAVAIPVAAQPAVAVPTAAKPAITVYTSLTIAAFEASAADASSATNSASPPDLTPPDADTDHSDDAEF